MLFMRSKQLTTISFQIISKVSEIKEENGRGTHLLYTHFLNCACLKWIMNNSTYFKEKSKRTR